MAYRSGKSKPKLKGHKRPSFDLGDVNGSAGVEYHPVPVKEKQYTTLAKNTTC